MGSIFFLPLQTLKEKILTLEIPKSLDENKIREIVKKDKLSQNLILNRLPYGFIKHQDTSTNWKQTDKHQGNTTEPEIIC